MTRRRLAAVISHPIQYYAPIFRTLASACDLHVFYGRPFEPHHAESGFGVRFEWDSDLFSGYEFSYLVNQGFSVFRNHLRKSAFDAVLVMGWYQPVLRRAIIAAKLAMTPVIIRGDSHLGMPRTGLKRTLQAASYPTLLRACDAVAFVGQRSKEYFLHFSYPAKRLFYSPHCVDTRWFENKATGEARSALRGKLGISRETRVVLFAGKLVPFKRPLDVVAATAALREQGMAIELMIAGAGELEEKIREEATTRHLPIHMLGFQNQSEMPAAYAAADALVLPSDGRETWGLVCNEALASGTPIVVSDAVGCAPDLAADEFVGRRFQHGDSSACASVLAKLFRSPPSPHAIAEVSQRFSLDAAVSGVRAALDAVTAGSPKATSKTAHAHSS